MKEAIDTGLPKSTRPFEWAILAGGVVYLVGSPIAANGLPEPGGPAAQAQLVVANMQKALQAAGGSLADVTQAMVYVTDRSYVAPLNEAWTRAFPPPYPNRAMVLVNEIGAPGIGVVVMAQAYLGSRATSQAISRASKKAAAPRRKSKR